LIAYGLAHGVTDAEILAELFKRYEALTTSDQLDLAREMSNRTRARKNPERK